MKKQQKMQKPLAIVGAIGGSLLFGLPTIAMPVINNNQKLAQANYRSTNSPLNPHPSIFNEPPYSGASNSSTDNSAPPMAPMPGGQMNQMNSPSTPANPPSSSSIENSNPPATNPSPYLQQQQLGGATQPTNKPGGNGSSPPSTSIENSNPPATNPSPYLQQQQTGGATQPTNKPGKHHHKSPPSTSIENSNPPATNPSPYLRQQQTGGATQPQSYKMNGNSLALENQSDSYQLAGSSMYYQQGQGAAHPGYLHTQNSYTHSSMRPGHSTAIGQVPYSPMVTPINGKVSVDLVNRTGAVVRYQVITDTRERILAPNSSAMLQNLQAPVNLFFQRPDGGLVKVTTYSSRPGMLEAVLTPTTSLNQSKLSLEVQRSGRIILN